MLAKDAKVGLESLLLQESTVVITADGQIGKTNKETMANYKEEQESLIRDSKATTQAIDFAGLVKGNVSPTDFDMVWEVDDEILILVEIKRKNNELTMGQGLAYTRVARAWYNAGMSMPKWGMPKKRKAIFIFATHTVYNTDRNVLAAECNIERLYLPQITKNDGWIYAKDLPDNMLNLKSAINTLGKNWKCDKLKFE